MIEFILLTLLAIAVFGGYAAYEIISWIKSKENKH